MAVISQHPIMFLVSVEGTTLVQRKKIHGKSVYYIDCKFCEKKMMLMKYYVQHCQNIHPEEVNNERIKCSNCSRSVHKLKYQAHKSFCVQLYRVKPTIKKIITSAFSNTAEENSIRRQKKIGRKYVYYVDCEFCDEKMIFRGYYVGHCEKLHPQEVKDERRQCPVCYKSVHHLLYGTHIRSCAERNHDRIFGPKNTLSDAKGTSKALKHLPSTTFFRESSPGVSVTGKVVQWMECLICTKLVNYKRCAEHIRKRHV